MKTNPILEEIWRIKDDLAKEAGNDLHQICENTRKWVAQNPHAGIVVRNAGELRQLMAQEERKRAQAAALVLKGASDQKH